MYPVLFQLGHFALRSYGVMIAVAFIIGLYVARIEARRKGIEEEKIVNFSLYALIAGIIGARIYYITFYDLRNYLTHPAQIFAVWKGGLAVHGAIIAGVLLAIWFAKRQRISFWKFADTLAPSLILGQAIGRIACLLNGGGYGTPTRLPWGIVFPKGTPASFAYGSQPLHPVQVYEMLIDFSIFLFLWKWRKKGKYDGNIFLLYLVLYAVGRSFAEIFRGDSLYVWGTHLKTAQMIGILIIIISLPIMRFLGRKARLAG